MKIAKFISSVVFLALLSSCGRRSDELETKIQTIDLERLVFACDCADWVKVNDFSKDNYSDSAIFIEPADSTLTLPDTLGYSMDVIRFTGQFYKQKGYPKGYHSIEYPDKAKIFRYTHYKIIKSNYRESQILQRNKD